jgi:uncharacterized protein YbjT (DUF2867 family)
MMWVSSPAPPVRVVATYVYDTYMSTDEVVLVTGATGTIGRLVVPEVLKAGRSVRAASRDRSPSRAAEEGVERVELDFTRPQTWRSAFEGVRVMFVVRPPQLSAVGRDMVPALTAAREAGVEHMVLLSLQGAERNPVVPHARLETWLRASGVGWTFVRPSFFMENLSTTHAGDIRGRHALMMPAGRGRTAFVAAHDVAAVAAAALVDPASHRSRAWTPTGPEALSYHAVAAVLTDVLGRPVRYAAPGLVSYGRHARTSLAMPWPMVAVTAAIYTSARLGLAAGLTADVQRVTGRAPTRLSAWAEQHAEVWDAGR